MSVDHFSTATEMLAALEAKQISSEELTELHIQRIEEHDGPLNAIPVRTFDRARDAARDADRRIAAGETGALLGLPMTLKESTMVAGLPQTAGLPAFQGYAPQADGPHASATFEAGACLLGKTNIPVALGDWQADSPVYGRTCNPWDTTRTPGGSTGGGGAALAAGLTPLELGSDIGGSIRVPAAYCGVFGHRPSETALPKSGAFPMADLPNPVFLLGTQGPLARSATDLELYFNVLAGPEPGEHVGWSLSLPPARAESLRDFRVALIDAPLGVSESSAMRGALDAMAEQLRQAGARVEHAVPEIDMQSYFQDYARILNAMISQGTPREERLARATELRSTGDPNDSAMADGFDMDTQTYLEVVGRREVARVAWARFFGDWDIVLAPMTLDHAFEHQEAPFAERSLTVDNRTVPYMHNILYPMVAIYPGLPATAFPAGLSPAGLPLGLQAIGPYLEDKTTLRFAQLVEQAFGGFQAPPGY